MSKVSVFIPYLASRPEQFVPYLALVQNTPACRLWTGQPISYDVHQGFAYGAGLGLRVPVGTAVTLIPLRHPFEAAMQARGLALTTGHPVVAGFGVGATGFQRAILGRPYASPLTAMREFLTITRALLEGEPVSYDGEYFSLHGGQPTGPGPRVHLGAGVLRPGMAELAGEVADVAITWLAPPEYVRDVLIPHLEKGAVRAGRPVPRVVCAVPAALHAEGRDPVALMAAANGRHLQAPHYGDMLAKAGIAVDPADVVGTARRLLDAGVLAYGEAQDVAERVATYHRAGADEVAIHLAGPSAGQPAAEALEELRALVRAVAGA